MTGAAKGKVEFGLKTKVIFTNCCCDAQATICVTGILQSHQPEVVMVRWYIKISIWQWTYSFLWSDLPSQFLLLKCSSWPSGCISYSIASYRFRHALLDIINRGLHVQLLYFDLLESYVHAKKEMPSRIKRHIAKVKTWEEYRTLSIPGCCFIAVSVEAKLSMLIREPSVEIS